MLTVTVLLALSTAARWCAAAPSANEYYVRGMRKIDGDPTALMLDINDYSRPGYKSGAVSLGTDSPQSTGAYVASSASSYEPSWDWSLFGSATGRPALAEKVSLDKKYKTISTADLPSFLPSLPTFSLPSFLTPSTSSVGTVSTPTFTSSYFPNFNLFQPVSNLFPSNIPKPTWPSASSFPIIRLPGSIERSGTATVNGVPAPQTQLLVFRYPDVVSFVRNGLSAIANGFNSLTSFFSGVQGNLNDFISGNGIVISGREPDSPIHKDWEI